MDQQASRWHISVDRAVIQDGRHPDFHRGQQTTFAATFRPAAWAPGTSGGGVADGGVAGGAIATAVRVEASLYDVVGRVTAVADDGWELDCGLVVGCEGPPPAGLGVGGWVVGRAELAVGDRGPDHTWFIERVHHRVADDVEVLDLGLMGGPEEPGWEELAFTNAWQDDDGQAEYLLDCLLVVDEGPN
ncbi:MAG: hypothetical protein V7605_2340 [Acidimicrobiaceae bacterium]